jgi:hypothetical protein
MEQQSSVAHHIHEYKKRRPRAPERLPPVVAFTVLEFMHLFRSPPACFGLFQPQALSRLHERPRAI